MTNFVGYLSKTTSRFFKSWKIQYVPFHALRHNDRCHYVTEGYGGQPLTAWPVFHFFQAYLQGDNSKAHDDFVCWYAEQFQKYGNEPKAQGGMRLGSLYRLVASKHDERGLAFDRVEAADPEVLRAAISQRVRQRFALLEEIRRHGYQQTGDKIPGVKKRELIYLRGGHHRSVILRLLGLDHLLKVVVYSSEKSYFRAKRGRAG